MGHLAFTSTSRRTRTRRPPSTPGRPRRARPRCWSPSARTSPGSTARHRGRRRSAGPELARTVVFATVTAHSARSPHNPQCLTNALDSFGDSYTQPTSGESSVARRAFTITAAALTATTALLLTGCGGDDSSDDIKGRTPAPRARRLRRRPPPRPGWNARRSRSRAASSSPSRTGRVTTRRSRPSSTTAGSSSARATPPSSRTTSTARLSPSTTRRPLPGSGVDPLLHGQEPHRGGRTSGLRPGGRALRREHQGAAPLLHGRVKPGPSTARPARRPVTRRAPNRTSRTRSP